jgi:hypothetical protein
MIVTFDDHNAVKRAIGQLVDAGLNVRNFSVVGRSDQNSQIERCDTQGTYWGDLSHVVSARISLTLPAIGSVVVLGHLGTMLISVTEAAPIRKVVAGSLSALGTALFHYGLPRKIATDCEKAVKANRLLVIGYGTTDEMAQAEAILKAGVPRSIVVQEGV